MSMSTAVHNWKYGVAGDDRQPSSAETHDIDGFSQGFDLTTLDALYTVSYVTLIFNARPQYAHEAILFHLYRLRRLQDSRLQPL